MKKIIRWVLVGVFSLIFVVGSVMTIRLLLQQNTERDTFKELSSMVIVGEDTSNDTIESPYIELKEENSDFFGWLSIEGTQLDYPVMFTPDRPQYYLRRDFYGNSSNSGVPFLDDNYTEGCGNYLIYGHNMHNGTMFATLLSYEDKQFWQEHPTINFDTLNEQRTYAILGVFFEEIRDYDSQEGFLYFEYIDVSNEEVFNEYITRVKSISLYDTGVQANYGDQLLTLSTCSYHTDGGRFVVVAKKN